KPDLHADRKFLQVVDALQQIGDRRNRCGTRCAMLRYDLHSKPIPSVDHLSSIAFRTFPLARSSFCADCFLLKPVLSMMSATATRLPARLSACSAFAWPRPAALCR